MVSIQNVISVVLLVFLLRLSIEVDNPRHLMLSVNSFWGRTLIIFLIFLSCNGYFLFSMINEMMLKQTIQNLSNKLVFTFQNVHISNIFSVSYFTIIFFLLILFRNFFKPFPYVVQIRMKLVTKYFTFVTNFIHIRTG